MAPWQKFWLLALIALFLAGCVAATPVSPVATPTSALPPLDLTPGQVTTVQSPFGTYWQYIPTTLAASPNMVVLVHGTPAEDDDSALAASGFYLDNWLDVAEQRGLILLAPAFDNENFGSHEGPLGGYRGLFGRYSC